MRARPPAVLPLLLWVLPIFAEEPPEEERPPPSELYISEVRQLEDLSDPMLGKAFALLGRVTVELPGIFRLRAQRMVVWLHPDADRTILSLVKEARREDRGIPLWLVRAVYAEGGRLPAVFQTAGRIFRCASLYYDFGKHHGVLVDAELRLRRAVRRADLPDLVLRAKRLRAVRPGRWLARDVRFFSSNYHEHEVVIEVERVDFEDRAVEKVLGKLIQLRRRDYRGGQGPTREEVDAVLAELTEASADVAAKHATLHDVTARAYGVRFFRWRKLKLDGEDLMPLRVELDVGGRGRLQEGVRLGIGLRKKPVAWLLGAGYYKDRGPLFDLELEVDAFGGQVQGRSFAAYLHDHGDDLGVTPPTRDRWWTKNQYRWLISEVWRVDAEYAGLSDPAWLRTYDEAEFKEGTPQQTLLYLRGRGERGYLALSYKFRTISFQDEVEELPRFFGSLPVFTLLQLGETSHGEPITLQVAGNVEIANLRHRAGLGGTLPDFRSVRVDLDPTLYVSFNLGPVRVVPFGTFEVTAYEHDLAGDSVGRFAGSAGVRADIQLARWFGDYRHVVNLSVEYVDMYSVTEDAASLFPFDARDQLTPFESVGARWRNRLLKRTPQGLVDILDLEIFGAWFPDGQRPLGETGDGFVEADLDWRVRRNLRLGGRAQVDLEHGRLDTASLLGDWQVRPDLEVGAMFRHLEGDSDILTAGVRLTVDTRWELYAFSQIDFKNDDSLDQGLLVRRFGKTAVVSVRFFYDVSDDDFTVNLKLDLLEKFRRSRRTRDSEREEVRWGIDKEP
ncbi:MAG: LPS assembly protein LptD [Planctomycetota bacterium]|jgi:hypothetical protein